MAKFDPNKWYYLEDKDRWLTPVVRLQFVAVAKKFKGKDAKEGDDGSYCTSFIEPPTTDKSAINKAISKLSKETFKDKKGNDVDILKDGYKGTVRSPFLDAEELVTGVTSKGEDVDMAGWTVCRPNAYSRRPVVRDNKAQELDLDDIETEVYPGRWCRQIVQLKAYNRPDNKGIKFYVDSLQVLKNDDNIGVGGGSKGEEFEAVDEDDDGDEDALD